MNDLPRTFALKQLIRRRGPPFSKAEIDLINSPVFVVGELGDAQHAWVVEAMNTQDIRDTRLPFPTVVYEFRVSRSRALSYVAVASSGELGAGRPAIFMNLHWEVLEGKFKASEAHICLKLDSGTWSAMNGDTRTEITEDDGPLLQRTAAEFQWITTCILLCNQCPAGQTRALPASQRPLGKAAKVPRAGWEYRIVTLPLPPTDRPQVGERGTHASPRWHERRGHWRRMGEDRKVWVRHCEVGRKEFGGVVHDYQLREMRAT